MPLAQATVSQHLKILKEAGLIRGEIEGRNSCYCLDPVGIARAREALDRLLGELTAAAWATSQARGDDDMRSADETRTLVRERYAAIARERASCCAPASCGCGPEMAPDGLNVIGDAYAGVAGHVAEADLNLGCGVPTRLAALRPARPCSTSAAGAGNDAFIARHEVGAEGQVIGVDMTPEMIAKARANAAKLGYGNVEFRLGEIEHLPVDAGSVDVVISNCVLNLRAPEGARVRRDLPRAEARRAAFASRTW